MAKYNFYPELRENLAVVLRKAAGVSRKKLKRMGVDPVSAAMRFFFQDPLAYGTIDGAVLMDEEDYINLGRRVFVPEDGGLVEMLWRSKMNVDPEDLGGFPRGFSIAWPAGTVIDGVELPGCLVWFGDQRDRTRVAELMDKWTPFPYAPPTQEELGAHPEWWAEGQGFHLSFADGEAREKRAYVRLSLPPEWLSECLRSEDELGAIGSFKGFAAQELTREDVHRQYVVTRCAVNLMVYATACPEAVVPGWPATVGASPNTRGRMPLTLASPAGKERRGGAHASPEAHLRAGRAPYFRSYPRRKDGSKKKGIYLVRGHGPVMVNAEVDPSTIKRDDDGHTC